MNSEHKPDRFRCDVCGVFISLKDLIEDKAIHTMITPDSDLSSETWETLCKKHKESK